MAQMNYEDYITLSSGKGNTKNNSKFSGQRVSFFALKDDGDSAIVRFNIADIKDLVVHSQHFIRVGEKFRKVECLRNYNDPIDICPLCENGDNTQYKIYIELLSYEIVNGKVVATPCVWEQGARYRETLKTFFMEFGDLRNIIFKITRRGKRGDRGTSYTIIPANPQVYKDEDYIADFSAFNTFDLHKGIVLNKTREELEYYLINNDFPTSSSNTTTSSTIETIKVEEHTPYDSRFVGNTSSSTIRQSPTEGVKTTTSPRRYTY